MNEKLLIIFCPNGYNIICEDGTKMEFVDGTATEGIKNLKTAIKICEDHEYRYEIV